MCTCQHTDVHVAACTLLRARCCVHWMRTSAHERYHEHLHCCCSCEVVQRHLQCPRVDLPCVNIGSMKVAASGTVATSRRPDAPCREGHGYGTSSRCSDQVAIALSCAGTQKCRFDTQRTTGDSEFVYRPREVSRLATREYGHYVTSFGAFCP